VDAHIRELTEAELASFRENGWALLKGLLDPELASALFERAMPMTGEPGLAGDFGIDPQPSKMDDLFHAVVFSKRMGRNALRVIRTMLPTDVSSVRYWTDNIFLKMPEGTGVADGVTEYHQDFHIGPHIVEDRIGKANFWVALHDCPPERSTLRFFSGSHKLGVLGPKKDPDGRSIVDVYPKLPEWCPLSPPLHLQPGDATIHHSLTVHGAPANSTDQQRCVFEFVYIHPDARHNGVVNDLTEANAPVELLPGKLFNKPIVYSEVDEASLAREAT
jgi:hypothetical protein